MKKIVCFLISLTFINSCCNTKSQLIGYIRIEYVGESDKPIPPIVLYNDTQYYHEKDEYMFEIRKQEINAIAKIIKSGTTEVEGSNSDNYFEYSILENKKIKLFSSNKNETTQKVLSEITRKMSKAKNDDLVKLLYKIQKRLP